MRQMPEATDFVKASAIEVESLQESGKHSRWRRCIIDGNKIGMAVLSLAPLRECEINAISDLTWSFIMDSLNFYTSLEYSGGGDRSVDGFVAILMGQNAARSISPECWHWQRVSGKLELVLVAKGNSLWYTEYSFVNILKKKHHMPRWWSSLSNYFVVGKHGCADLWVESLLNLWWSVVRTQLWRSAAC